jgi:para-aminobenzoate synthetase component 1
LAQTRSETVPGLPPFQGGAAGLFGYELGRQFERLPAPRQDEFRVPELSVGFYDWVAAFDHLEGRAWIVAHGWPATDIAARRTRAQERIANLRRIITRRETPSDLAKRADIGSTLRSADLTPQHPLPHLAGLMSNFGRDQYLAAVQRVIEYIGAGDCFQVNLAQRLLLPVRESALALYGKLRERSPAPFGGYFDLGDFVVASASPERFVQMDAAGRLESRPIKGTRPRGRTREDDERLRRELAASAKDRAENIMIVDLLRNDLGRVAAFGSVGVAQVCGVETYPTIHHLVSVVNARLRPGLAAVDVLRAAFPGGSVTGAPKIRAMEIIAELEPTARGPYCGCLGYLGFDGAMDTNILIRTFTVGRGWVQFPVGGGIVADSTPEGEYEETLHKAAGLFRALQ